MAVYAGGSRLTGLPPPYKSNQNMQRHEPPTTISTLCLSPTKSRNARIPHPAKTTHSKTEALPHHLIQQQDEEE